MKADATRPPRPIISLALLGAALLTATPALAQEVKVAKKAKPARLTLGAEALSEFPLMVGGRIWIELPGRVSIGTSLGYLPGAYEQAVNATLMSAGAYDSQTGAVIESVMEDSFIFRASIGWRPFAERGAYLRLGYVLAVLEGSLSTELVQAAAGSLPVPAAALSRYLDGYSMESTLHMLHAEIGWQWVVARGLSLRLGLGAAMTVGASSSIVDHGNHPKQISALLAPTEAYLDDILTSYVFTPTVTLAVGWQVGLL